MALKLTRSAASSSTPKENVPENKGFEVTGNAGTNYNLDTIQENKSRTSTGTLVTNVSNKSSKTEGAVSIKATEEKIIMNNADAAKYLFQNEPSTDAYTPSITLRRPIVIWEEGTPDTSVPDYSDNVYNSIYALEDRVKELEEQLKNK